MAVSLFTVMVAYTFLSFTFLYFLLKKSPIESNAKKYQTLYEGYIFLFTFLDNDKTANYGQKYKRNKEIGWYQVEYKYGCMVLSP